MMEAAAYQQHCADDRFSFAGEQQLMSQSENENFLNTIQSLPDDLGESLKRFQLQLEELLRTKRL